MTSKQRKHVNQYIQICSHMFTLLFFCVQLSVHNNVQGMTIIMPNLLHIVCVCVSVVHQTRSVPIQFEPLVCFTEVCLNFKKMSIGIHVCTTSVSVSSLQSGDLHGTHTAYAGSCCQSRDERTEIQFFV